MKVGDLSPLEKESLADPLNHIRDGVFLGNLGAAADKDLLRRNNIAVILQILDVDWVPFPSEFQYHQVKIDDATDVDIYRHFPSCCQVLDEALANRQNILVHCHMGQSRSPTVVIAWLMRRYRMTEAEAMALAVRSRPCVRPNVGFIQQLSQWAQHISQPIHVNEDT